MATGEQTIALYGWEEAQGENDFKGEAGANAAWGLAQSHWTFTMPTELGGIMDAAAEIDKLG